MKFRDLKGYEIDCRIGTINEKGLSLLLYKNARTDSTLLDETVGVDNWQNKFYECKGNLYCSVGINTAYNEPDGERWIWKDDCGAETYTEKEKGEASDAFKRACFKWGIGKPLYTSPFIWIKAVDCNLKPDRNNKMKCNDKFYVKYIEYADDKIVKLLIRNETKHKDVYAYGMSIEQQIPITNGISLEQIETICAYPNTALVVKALKGKKLADLTFEEGTKLINWLIDKAKEAKNND